MSLTVEIKLRVPSLRVQTESAPRKIANAHVRFLKTIELGSLPAPGATIMAPTSRGVPFACVVTRVDWEEERQMFVVSCQYGLPRISIGAYDELVGDSSWTRRDSLI
jgi:hypothetical protein